ncbi:hypothetical protein [Arthrobacter sp. NEB 688]|uniref:hypothetical protein n=1 Tax=Arthrobacter sp. NEB 688 TaxID=904039 RepID=UPI001567513C|nr:hypothetical protein [Arthrobacter sp. NEB 688]QKE85495.1 hypothetical protein HL663_17230 [Arthrobacter sp. NEB 688]
MSTSVPSDTENRSGRGVLAAAWLGCALLVALLLRLRTAPDVDLWLHLRIGRALRDGDRFQALPDPLTSLADRPYVPTQWLAQVGMSVVDDLAGVTGLHAVRALLLLALAGLAHASARRWAGPLASVGVAAAVLVGTSAAWGERPQLLGLVLAALALHLWTGTLVDGRPRWALLGVAWLWSAVHGSWPVGVALGALALVALAVARPRPPVRWGRLGALLVGTALVPVLGPLGPLALVEPFAVGVAARSTVNEWKPPAPSNPLLVLVVLLALVVVVRLVRARRADLPAVLLAVAGVALAATSVRTIATGALLLAPALARTLRPAPDPAHPWRERVPGLVAAAALLVVPGVVVGGPERGPLPRTVDAAVGALPAGTPTVADAYASGWVLWAHPGPRVLRDLRAEVYTPATAAAYEDFSATRSGWQDYARRHDVRAVLTRRGEPLDRGLAGEAGWTRAAAEGDWVLWTLTG